MTTHRENDWRQRFFNLKRRSLSKELTISLLIIVILFEGILLAVVYNRQSRLHLRELQAMANNYADNLAQVLSVPMWDFDDEQIAKIGAGILRNEEVDEIRILDTEANVLFASRKNLTSGNRIERAAEVRHQDQPIGRAEVYLSLDAYTAGLIWLRNAILLVLAVSLVLIFITTGLLLRVFMRKPLAILQKGIDRVAQGDYSYKFEEIHHSELTDIALRFSQMAEVVQTREMALQKVNRELQEEVAERMRAEAKIRESEAKSRALLDAIPDMMFRLDSKGNFIEFKGAQDELFLRPELFLNRSIKDVMPADLATLLHQRLEEALRSHRTQVFEYELKFNDSPKYFECRLVAVSDDQAVAIVRNITEKMIAAAERHRLEEQLRRAQKMEAIGTLAGGVAHDLNNVLSGLVSYPEVLLMDLSPDSPLRQPILTIQKSGERAATIVQDLLTLARRGVSVSEVIDLNDTINEYLKSPEYAKLKANHPDFKLDLDLDAKLFNVVGSPVHLSKTIMNLVANAAEALQSDGRIRIKTENRYIDRPIKGYDDINVGDYVVVKVSDNGVGISFEDIERIFEPFYTKKVMGHSGTGLGMAVVWGTVKDHNGYIDVVSIEGRGTTISVYLPASRKEIFTDEQPLSLEKYMGRGETLLIVDDMPDQLEIASHLLKKLGYRVATVASGEQAVEYVRENSIDLLVLDMIMEPGIDGLETYRRIIRFKPDQKAIIASGFSESSRVKEAERLGVGAYIKKPYLLEDIGKAIRTELSR